MHPHEMGIELQDHVFGKPQPGPVVIGILGLQRHPYHDNISFDALTSAQQRVHLTFTQAALRSLADQARTDIERPDRPAVG